MAITLLAVDDSVTMRKVLEITFASPDFRVVTANSADVALQRFKSDRPDLVISDITLDPKNGYELCKAVKQLSPGTPVLLLSSKQAPFDTGKGNAADCRAYMAAWQSAPCSSVSFSMPRTSIGVYTDLRRGLSQTRPGPSTVRLSAHR